MLRTISFVALLVLGITVVLSYLTLGPWVSLPEDPPEVIEARWAKVVGWAEGSPESVGTPGARARLSAALEAFASSEVLNSQTDDTAPIAEVDLDDDARVALAAFLRWSDAGGGLGDDPCIRDDSLSGPEASAEDRWIQPIALYRLAELAIRRSTAADDPHLRAALELGAALRGRGPLIYGVIGGSIADKARAFAVARGWSPSPAFRDLRPTQSAIFGIMARESFCQVRLLERAIARDEDFAIDKESGWRGLVQDHVGIEREMQMLRWYLGKRMADAHAASDDRAALLSALAPPEPDDLPSSLLLQTVMIDMSGHCSRYSEQVDSYDRFIAE